MSTPTQTSVADDAEIVRRILAHIDAGTTDQGDDRQIVIVGDADTQIRAEVTQRINERPVLRFANIDVQSFHNDVYLNGLVDTGAESAQAEAIARSVPGVSNVYNGLGLNGNGG